jgi:hypothetical protein
MEEPAATAVNPGGRESSYSNGGHANCVEVGALAWRKSTYSNGGGSNCVEAAHAPGAVLVRDTKDNGIGPVLRATPADWRRFSEAVRVGTALS